MLLALCLLCLWSLSSLLLVPVGLALAAGQLLPVAAVAVDVVLERVALTTLHAGVENETAVLKN